MGLYYNYRFNYDDGATTELIRCHDQINIAGLTEVKWQLIPINDGERRILINMDKIRLVEEWKTQE